MKPLEIAILGAGFGGLCAGIKLLESGRDDFLIFEKSGAIGGTWRDNTYPGCGCDIPAHLYSYSFAQDSGWTRTYASQPEILAYIGRVARRHGVDRKVQFETEIIAAVWDDESRVWLLTAADGRRYSARVVISAVGSLHVPKTPPLPGLDAFAGPQFHSARWRHDVDLAGKRVAVIGTGASAIQFVPRIAGRVAALHLFQRSPPWVLPRHDRPVSPWVRAACARVPWLQRLWRALQYCDSEAIALGFTVRPELLAFWQRQAERFLRSVITDPALADKLTPTYTLGCKRVLISDDFYPALARDNVELVTEPIREAEPTAIVTTDGRVRPVDVIIFATGFRPFDITAAMRVAGRGGRQLAADWRDGPEAYRGVAVAGYPNFFLLMGPNSALGHNSIIFMIEAQVRYVLQCLRWLDEARAPAGGQPVVEVRAGAQRAFNERLQRRFGRGVWRRGGRGAPGSCRSWYVHEGGRNHVLWPGFSASYWWALRKPDRRHFLPLTPGGDDDMLGPASPPMSL